MSGREHSDDSSGNLLASGESTVPDLTGDAPVPCTPDPNDTQQDPQAAHHYRKDRNVTNNPSWSESSIADDDTREDPFAVRRKQQSEQLAADDTMEDPQAPGKKVWPDPLAPDETVKEGHGQKRKVYPDPLAPDVTQPSVSSQATSPDAKSGGASAGDNTNWDPIGAPRASSGAAQSKPAKKKPGQNFSEGDLFARKYEIKGHIGQGGMGVVYKALDLVLGRTVAIKFLKGKSGISQLEMSRFQQEAKAIASLNHTNIIRVHDMSVTDEGDPFFVLEYLEGHALSSEIRGKKQLPLDRVFSIISQVCDALQHAHEHGVIHRDIKPSNLMIVPQKDGSEMVKLLDFGIAKLNPIDEQTLLKLTKTGELFGSPHYMSPEQCSGQTIDAQSDIYSLGCVLYELICGGPPFSGQSALDTLDKHKNASLPSISNSRKDLPLSESKSVDALLDKMMAKEPSDRYQTPAEVKAAIQQISKGAGENPFQQFKKKAFPNGLSDTRGKMGAAVVAAALMTLAGAVYLVSNIPNLDNSKAPNSVPVPPKPWKSYDLKGQQLFDMGSYPLAEKQLLLALEKAKADQTGKRKVRLFTSLQELRLLYTAWKKSDRVDWANSELLDLNAEQFLERTQSKFSWEEVSRLLSRAKSPEDLNQVVEMSRDLTINGNSISREQNTLNMLSLIRRKIEMIPNSELARDQFVLLESFQGMGEARVLSAEVKTVISKFAAQPVEVLTPAMANVLVTVGLGQFDSQLLEKFSLYASERGSSIDRLVALTDLSYIYLESKRKDAAKEVIEKCIAEAENQVPRPYVNLTKALLKRADIYRAEQNFLAAIALYRRALSISECVPSVVGSGLRSNTLRLGLARAYLESGNEYEAEPILVSICENPDRFSDLLRANSLRLLGLIYVRQNKLNQAEDSLKKSVAIYKSQKLSVRYHIDCFKAASDELARVQARLQDPSL